MLPSLQPSRPQVPRQAPQQFPYQQKRSINNEHTLAQSSYPQNQQQAVTSTLLRQPRSQVEAMPPFDGPVPPHMLYNSAICHPVFFTERMKRLPFPIPQMPSHGYNPVASGYIMEMKKSEVNGAPKTKL